ncbi:MAG TPA: hypothetical protein GX404_01900 [Syntrophomonadaceae bacterium]|nr:hypothetical protein [Syntrophomonadaceae bacterium]
MTKKIEDWKFELNCQLARFYESGGLWLGDEEDEGSQETQKNEVKTYSLNEHKKDKVRTTMTEEEKYELNCQLAKFYESGGLWDPDQETKESKKRHIA